MTAPPLPLTWEAARVVAEAVLGPDFVVSESGYEDDDRFLVPYTERDGVGWDLPVCLVDKATGWTHLLPWHEAIGLPDRMRPVSSRP